MDQVPAIVKRVNQLFKPISVFIYGSRATGENLPDSDWEIGLIYPRTNKISRGEIWKLLKDKKVVIYPFELESLKEGTIDTPFPQAFYLRHLQRTAKTIFGEKIIEKLKPVPISVGDLLEEINFDIGFMLAAVSSSFRKGDIMEAANRGSKSIYFALRCLICLELKKFPLTYQKIEQDINKINDPEAWELAQIAKKARNEKIIDENSLFKALSYFNKIIRQRVKQIYLEDPNRIILK